MNAKRRLLWSSFHTHTKTPAPTLTASGCCDPTVFTPSVFLLPRVPATSACAADAVSEPITLYCDSVQTSSSLTWRRSASGRARLSRLPDVLHQPPLGAQKKASSCEARGSCSTSAADVRGGVPPSVRAPASRVRPVPGKSPPPAWGSSSPRSPRAWLCGRTLLPAFGPGPPALGR